MSFLWARSLLLLGLIPLFIVFYVWLLSRRRRFTVRYSSLSLVREVTEHQVQWKRHIPFTLFLLALTSLAFAMARPVTIVTVPSNKSTIIMAIDVSPSMCSNDIKPNRLEAAKSAAETFVSTQAANHQIGIVAFAGSAELIQPPTDNVRSLRRAISSLVVAQRTALGSAILRSIDAISQVDGRVAPSEPGTSTKPAAKPVPHIIVLLTDGASNAGPHPLDAAHQAMARGVRVYTIGFGTDNPNAVMDCTDQFHESNLSRGSTGFSVGGNAGSSLHGEIDVTTLKQIAYLTGGTYYAASSASELKSVFKNLPTIVVETRKAVEISVFFTAFSAFVMILAVLLSWRWHPLS